MTTNQQSSPVTQPTPRQTVLIIGAGPAGLTAARTLQEQTAYQPIILETESRVGGLSRTEIYRGNRIDLGGHRFFTRDSLIQAIWQALLPTQGQPSSDDRQLNREQPWAVGGPDPERTDRVMLIRNRVSRIFFDGHFFDYPLTINAELLKNLGLKRVWQIGVGYLAARLRPRPEESLEDFYINRFGQPLYQLFFENYTEKLWGIHPSQIAPDWGAQRVKGLSLAKAILSVLTRPFRRLNGTSVETSLIESFHYPKYGPGQLWETLADEIIRQGGTIHLNTRVETVRCHGSAGDSTCQVEVVLADGRRERFDGSAVFSSMAIRDLAQALDPKPPAAIASLTRDLPYRDFITVGVLVDRLALTQSVTDPKPGRLVPDCWIYIQDRSVQLGRLQIFNNWSPYLVADPQHTVWIGLEYFANEGDSLWSMSDDAFITFACAELVSIGIIRPEAVLDHVIFRVSKAYPAYFGSYSQFDQVRSYLDSQPGLYCIGRNGQHRYNNMDHAMLTGIEAVRCLTGQSTRNDLWSVNTEKKYGE